MVERVYALRQPCVDVEVGQGADLAFEVLVIGFTGLALDAQVFHRLPQREGKHDDAAGLVLLLAHDLGAYPHHEQPGLLPVRPDMGDALPQGRHGLRLEDVGISAYFDNRRTDLLYFFIVR